MRYLVPLAAALALGLATPAEAQVRGAVVVGGGPVSGAVVFGDRAWRRPPPARVIVLEDWRGPRGRARGWWRHRGFRPVAVYRDRFGYYDRWYDGRPDLVKVIVYERDGHFYDPRWFDDRWDDRRWDDRRWDDRRWDGRRGRDRWDDDDRWDDRRDRDWDDRDDRRGRGRDRRDD